MSAIDKLPPLPPIDDYLPTDGPRWTTANFIACVERYAKDYALSALNTKPAEPLTESQILWGYYAAATNSMMAHDHFKAGALFAQKHFGVKEKA